jgi:hypothetical protein
MAPAWMAWWVSSWARVRVGLGDFLGLGLVLVLVLVGGGLVRRREKGGGDGEREVERGLRWLRRFNLKEEGGSLSLSLDRALVLSPWESLGRTRLW